MRTRHRLLLAIALATAATGAGAQSVAVEDLGAFPRTTVVVSHGHGAKDARRFEVWVADTPQRQEQGLMFVRELPAGRGMLFPKSPPGVAKFWMKNTYIPLDMVFIGPDHRILRIAARTQPFSLALVGSGGPVIAVLEIAGGEAERLGVTVGDQVSW